MQSDPIGLAGGLNTYGYVGGNPLNSFDFFGLLECSCRLASGSGGTGYKNGRKQCSYKCTNDDGSVTVTGGSSRARDGDVCYGADGWKRTYQGNTIIDYPSRFGSFDVDTKPSLFDKIFGPSYQKDKTFMDNIEDAFDANKK